MVGTSADRLLIVLLVRECIEERRTGHGSCVGAEGEV